MALYRYNARDRENRKYKGVKEAGSEAELVKALLVSRFAQNVTELRAKRN